MSLKRLASPALLLRPDASVSRRVASLAAMAAQQPAASLPASATYRPRYVDIGINLADPVFRGRYHGSQRHPDDLDAVVGRARDVGCSKFIVTGSDLQSARDALQLAREYPGAVYATAGIHPCSSAVFASHGPHGGGNGHTVPCDPDPAAPIPEHHAPDATRSSAIIAQLSSFIADATSSGQGNLVAFGEFGLDYDRLHYCNKAVQLHSFESQLRLAASLSPQLPLFLHSRAAHSDFVALLKAAFGHRLERLHRGGVVHSFTGTADEMRELMDLGLYIGINGCSFKTEQNCSVVREIHLDRIMLETDGPWCEVRPSHEGHKYLIDAKPAQESMAANGTATAPGPQGNKKSNKNRETEPDLAARFKAVKKEKWQPGAMVKGRNEPCSIERVAKIVAGIKGISLEEVCEAAWRNTAKVFALGQQD